ncbi:hypothetical protein L6164_000919 [Bauhinia variegata]|uniref:Uncharacterized protein n=1 Tax=Bauhinia variegata TaxID=167791 RepID=A0ACB9Q7C2_BAUVA|nr:hypothetical protein L6164_000919 [Bauhinia variegata]
MMRLLIRTRPSTLENPLLSITFLPINLHFHSALALFVAKRSRLSLVLLHPLKMATAEFSGLHIAMSGTCIPSSQRFANTGVAVLGGKSKVGSCNKLASAYHIASVQPLQRGLTSSSIKSDKIITKAMSESSENKPVSGLPK